MDANLYIYINTNMLLYMQLEIRKIEKQTYKKFKLLPYGLC